MLPFPQLFQYGNIIPPVQYNVLFSMHDFTSTADIKDKSSNNITVTNAGAVSVGSNTYGTYMNFNGVNTSYLNFKDNKLAIGTNMEIYFKVSGLIYRGGQYLTLLLDTRPVGTNGNYYLFGYTSNAAAPFKIYNNINNSGDNYSTLTLPADTTVPIEIRIRLLSTGTYVYVNDTLYNTSSQVLNINTLQNYTIGKNAFSSTAATPFLNAQIYKFEIRQLLNV